MELCKDFSHDFHHCLFGNSVCYFPKCFTRTSYWSTARYFFLHFFFLQIPDFINPLYFFLQLFQKLHGLLSLTFIKRSASKTKVLLFWFTCFKQWFLKVAVLSQLLLTVHYGSHFFVFLYEWSARVNETEKSN